MRRIGEGMTWDALVVELDRLSDFGLGRDPQWNGITLHWLAKNEENYTKLTCGNYRRPAEKPAEMTIAQRRALRMAPRKESGTEEATHNPLSFSRMVDALDLPAEQAARLRSHTPLETP